MKYFMSNILCEISNVQQENPEPDTKEFETQMPDLLVGYPIQQALPDEVAHRHCSVLMI